MEGLFHQRCAARLRDILQKAKDQAHKPPWMGVDTWAFLLAKWETKEFKDVSKQNKINRSSSRGGAVHTSGRIAHHDVALELAKKLKRPAHPDELFIATHKKKNVEWVDERAAKTHETYVSNVTQATQSGDDVHGSTRIQMWKEVVGGKTRGQCYEAAQLARNVRYGVSFLTQVSITNPNREADNQAIEAARAETAAAREKLHELMREQVNWQNNLKILGKCLICFSLVRRVDLLLQVNILIMIIRYFYYSFDLHFFHSLYWFEYFF
ncbi:uncharacterized protein LOC131613759 isoform X1 [Vicia villosa]|uniref:uncharacterized protein LOC131613759 isoform X1 n=1 Tax=Vicia villosa TaxID=3911 RepID=UPI00273AD1E7|nr:uncharacterized protein LOC131613759 isoform X1 [Vicia villosa]